MTAQREPRSRLLIGSLIIVAAVLLWLLIANKRTEPKSAERALDTTTSPPPEGTSGASATPAPNLTAPPGQLMSTAPPTRANGKPWWRPGQPHDYGEAKDPFVRQPLDYGPDTPKILGNRISYNLYDLETVQDMVRRGTSLKSEIARTMGRPLTAEEKSAARSALQAFFDEAVPVIDGVIGGARTQDSAYAFLGQRRRQLNTELRNSLNLSQEQFYAIWPHARDVDQNRGKLREPDRP